MMRAFIVSALALGSVACSPVVGSTLQSDVCARVSQVAGDPARYAPVERSVPNLETCAARLEAIRMTERRAVTGFYNGHFIFVTEADILSAQTLDGARFRVFEPKDRKTIQDGIQVLIDGKMAETSSSR